MVDSTGGKIQILVMCSGSGTNLQALIDGCADGTIPGAAIVKVITNRKTAFAAQRADKAGIPAVYFNLVNRGYMSGVAKDDEAAVSDARERYDDDLGKLVLLDRPDLVVLAGWMHVFSPKFLAHLDAAGIPVINLHPALPGRYDGANAIGRAYDDFQAGKLENGRTGVMIHYVIAAVDRGDAILVEEVECRAGESLEQLEERIHEVEHGLIVRATSKIVQELAAKRK